MSKLLSRLSCRQIARVGFVFCALALVATPVFAQPVAPPKDFVPPKPPKDYKPLDVGPCEKPPQSIGLELHTTSASGADPHSIVTDLPAVRVMAVPPPITRRFQLGRPSKTTGFNLTNPPLLGI